VTRTVLLNAASITGLMLTAGVRGHAGPGERRRSPGHGVPISRAGRTDRLIRHHSFCLLTCVG
jgi:hypothetical protein